MIGRTLGHYRILEKIGTGGMGEVYRARDEHLSRDVAIKVLPEGLLADDSARKRFRREALALSQLNHPNIATVHDFDTTDGTDFLVMEYITGRSLNERVSAGAVGESEILALGTQIAEGLAVAHGQGIVHRDLKPGNLRVTPDDRVKVLDFGLAKLVERAETATVDTLSQDHGLTGTVPYMAPEQLRGDPVDARADLWALGAVLYEMATGRRPFPQTHTPAVIDAILNREPAPAGQLSSRVSPGLEAVILKALEKDPNRRYQSARELRVDLERLRRPEGQPQVARRRAPAPWRRLLRPRWATPLVLIAATLVVIFWFTGQQPVLSFQPRDWIVVADFDNQTGEAVFDRSLHTALTVSLEQSTHANLVPRARASQTLRRMEKSGEETITEELGREIALRENARALVVHSISQVGAQYLLAARLVDPATGQAVRSYQERARGKGEVLEALDEIAADLRRDLGESLLGVTRRSRPLPQVTTSSLPALKAYSDANVLWAQGKHGEAVELYQTAVEHDPEFAMAHEALGRAYASHIYNDTARAKEHLERALELADRTTERERQLIEIAYHSSLGHLEETFRLSNVYLEQYPDDFVVRYNLGSTYMRSGRPAKGVEQLEEALRINPQHASAYINVATAYGMLGDYEKSLENYAEAFELEPSWKFSGNLNHEYGFVLVQAGQVEKARGVFRQALDKQELGAKPHRSLALLDLYLGKYESAEAHLKESLLRHRAQQAPLSEARDLLFLAILRAGRGDRSGALQALDQSAARLDSLGPQVWLAARVAAQYARHGAVEKAERLLEVMQEQADPQNPQQKSTLHWVEGELELARGNHQQAVEVLLLGDRVDSSPFIQESLARAYRLAGDPERAIGVYEEFLKKKTLGWEPQQDWLAAHYHLAKLHQTAGDKEQGREVVARLLSVWQEADSDLPLLARARDLREQL